VQQTVFFIVKSKPTAIFTVVFRGVSVQTAIGLDLSVVSRGVQVSLGRKDFGLAYNGGVSVVFPWCSGVFRIKIFFVGLKHHGTPGGLRLK
jgi:hypothetical protein